MEQFARQLCGGLKTFDGIPCANRLGIARCGQDHAERGAWIPLRRHGIELACQCRLAQQRDVRTQAHQYGLCFRITEPAVEFNHPRCAGGIDHESRVEKTREGRAVGREPAHSWGDDLPHHTLVHGGRHHRGGRVGAHPPGIGTPVGFFEPLVILCACKRHDVLPVRHDDEARFLALQEFLDDDLISGIAETPRQHLLCRGVGLVQCLGDHHALARRQTAGLDDDGGPLGAQPRRIVVGAREGPVRRRRHRVSLQELLGECLGTLEPRGLPGRSKAREPCCLERIDDAGYQRRFRADDGQPHRLSACQIDHPGDVCGRDRYVAHPRLGGGTGVTRRDDDLADAGGSGAAPGQRMLAAASADDQHFHD